MTLTKKGEKMKTQVEPKIKTLDQQFSEKTGIDVSNKRQILIFPSELRIKFWLLYCKSKYEKGKPAGLADAHKALFHYDKNLEKYAKKKIYLAIK